MQKRGACQVTPADTMHMARQQSLRWRDMLWESVLEEMEERNPDAAVAARAAAAARPARALYGASAEAARLAWPYLDVEARLDWVWVCEFVNRIWARPFHAIVETSLGASATA